MTLIHAHERDVVFLHQYIENRAADRDHGGRRVHLIVIGLVVQQLLDVNFDVPDDDIQNVGPVRAAAAKDRFGVLEDFEGAAVGNAELRITVGTGNNDFSGSNRSR